MVRLAKIYQLQAFTSILYISTETEQTKKNSAAHFRTLLQNYPPQTSSRESASQWGCSVHNHVNARLKKPEFDCSTIAEKYKCGCADADKEENQGKGKEKYTSPLNE